MDRQEFIKKTNWKYDNMVYFKQFMRYNASILAKRTQYNIKNFRKHPFFFRKRGMRIDIDPFTLKNEKDWKRWIEKRLPSRDDGEYFLVGAAHKTNYITKFHKRVPTFRYIAKFTARNGRVVKFEKRSKGKPYGRKFGKGFKKNRPARYFAMWQALHLIERFGVPSDYED